MYDFDFDKGRKKEKEKEKEKFNDSKPRHFPRKWPRQKYLGGFCLQICNEKVSVIEVIVIGHGLNLTWP